MQPKPFQREEARQLFHKDMDFLYSGKSKLCVSHLHKRHFYLRKSTTATNFDVFKDCRIYKGCFDSIELGFHGHQCEELHLTWFPRAHNQITFRYFHRVIRIMSIYSFDCSTLSTKSPLAVERSGCGLSNTEPVWNNFSIHGVMILPSKVSEP